MADGEIGEGFAIDLDSFLVEEIDESRIIESESVNRIVDTDSPEIAESSFLEFTTNESVGSCLHDSIFDSRKYIPIHHAESFRTIDEIFMSFFGHETTFYAYHRG